jgi:hypothetical protein
MQQILVSSSLAHLLQPAATFSLNCSRLKQQQQQQQ